MNLQETAKLLARAQLIDNRRIDEAVILEWHQYVADIALPVALEALTLHRQESTEYLVPAHIVRNVERILTAPESPEDEWGNPLEPDAGALRARIRATRSMREVTS